MTMTRDLRAFDADATPGTGPSIALLGALSVLWALATVLAFGLIGAGFAPGQEAGLAAILPTLLPADVTLWSVFTA